MNAIVDFQGFKDDNNDFIVKELVVMCVETGHYNQWLFKPPTNFTPSSDKILATNHYLAKYHHGLLWDSGTIDYFKLPSVLRLSTWFYNSIYAMGLEKSKYLSPLIRRYIRNLEYEGCPSVKKLPQVPDVDCSLYQHSKFACAVQNASRLQQWAKKKQFVITPTVSAVVVDVNL